MPQRPRSLPAGLQRSKLEVHSCPSKCRLNKEGYPRPPAAPAPHCRGCKGHGCRVCVPERPETVREEQEANTSPDEEEHPSPASCFTRASLRSDGTFTTAQFSITMLSICASSVSWGVLSPVLLRLNKEARTDTYRNVHPHMAGSARSTWEVNPTEGKGEQPERG